MKMCLRCRKLYAVDMQFCFEDGNLLVNRNFYDTNTGNKFEDTGFSETSQPTLAISLPPHYTQRPAKKSKWILRVGLLSLLTAMLLLCGGFTWAAINVIVANRSAANTNKSAVDESRPKSDEVQKTGNVEKNDPKVTEKTKDSNLKKPSTNDTTKTSQSRQFNGRVIMLNAVLRAAPAIEAAAQETLPLDAPVKIGEKASANSPWYRITTASGAQGWMHGNTIEFN